MRRFAFLLFFMLPVVGAVPPAPGIAIHLSIAPDRSLRLALQNVGSKRISIITGTVVGSTPYPSACFHFFLEHQDHQRRELLCQCLGPAFVAGTLGPYTVTLKPGESFHTEIPLAAFRISSSNRALCPSDTPGARLRVTLPRGAEGTLSSSTPLACPTG